MIFAVVNLTARIIPHLTEFVQLQTNKFQGLFKDFPRTNYSFQELTFISTRHSLTPLITLLAKTGHAESFNIRFSFFGHR